MNTVLVTEELTGGHYLFKKGCDIVFVTALLIIIGYSRLSLDKMHLSYR